ncbi:MAG: WD40 repeat domain-containing protein, partial [Planctomycetota bacterium]
EIRHLKDLRPWHKVVLHKAAITALAWSADGRLLGSTANDGRLIVYDVAAREKILELEKKQPLYAVTFHPKGTAVAYGGHDRKVYQYTFAEEKEEVISKGQPYWITCLGYSPDGELIAVGDESCDIWLYEVKKKHMTFHNKHHNECWLSSVTWAPDNETFLFGCRPNSHAGKPAFHRELARTEAARTDNVCISNNYTMATIDKNLKTAKTDEERKALNAYRDLLDNEQEVRGSDTALAVDGGILQYEGYDATPSAGATFALQAKGVAMHAAPQGQFENLPKEVQDAVKKHNETVQKEMVRIQNDFRIHQWKVKRK